jgi:hypothetical protein
MSSILNGLGVLVALWLGLTAPSVTPGAAPAPAKSPTVPSSVPQATPPPATTEPWQRAGL